MMDVALHDVFDLQKKKLNDSRSVYVRMTRRKNVKFPLTELLRNNQVISQINLGLDSVNISINFTSAFDLISLSVERRAPRSC